MKKSITFIGILILTGCGYKEGVVSANQESYLYFTGNTKDAQVSIDQGAKFNIINGKNNQYSLKPGKHTVEVYKNGSIIVKRKIFISDGNSKEIEVK